MKTERVTLLTTPEFKAFLAAEAKREKVSVAELVRSRCTSGRSVGDDAALTALSVELRAAVVQAKKALRQGLAEAEATLQALHATSPTSTGPVARGDRRRAEKVVA